MSEARAPVEVFCPGVYIKDELVARGWTQADLAQIIIRSESTVNRLVSGKARMTADMAHRLAAAFNVEARHWMNLQTTYDLGKLRSVS